MGLYICVSDLEKKERDALRKLNCQMLYKQLLAKLLQIY